MMNVDTFINKRKRKVNIAQCTHAICMVSVSPIRRLADDRSEMTSQLLFGEMVKILSRKNNSWMRIECVHDGYIGWVDPKQFQLILSNEYHELKQDVSYALEISQPLSSDHGVFPILAGSDLLHFDGMTSEILKTKFAYSGLVLKPNNLDITAELITKVAKKYLHAPYLWGGRSPFGIDCSGFTQVVFKMLGISLPRDAYQQAEYGDLIDFVDSAQVGDLAFFVNDQGRIHHVGIILEGNKIIHASGMVKIDNIDHFGIYSRKGRAYTHVLRYIKRML